MKQKKGIMIILIIGLFIFTGCNASTQEEQEKPEIYTSVYPLEYIVKTIAGDTIDVKSVYPIDADIHSYQLTSKDFQNILESDAFIYIDKKLENYLPEIEDAVKQKESDVKLVSISESLKKNDDSDAFSEVNDYHYWLSPKKSLLITDIIYEQLNSSFPQNKDIYSKNYDTLHGKLKTLDEEYENFAKTQTKPIIVAHDAYFWLREDYEIDIIGMYGSDHHDEPSAKEIQEAIDLVNSKNVSTIFVEQNDLNNSVIKQISSETSTKVEAMNNLSTKTDEEEDYVDELEKNLQLMEQTND